MPINKASGVPHNSPTERSRLSSSVPTNPKALPPKIKLDSTISFSELVPTSLIKKTYLPFRTFCTLDSEKTTCSAEMSFRGKPNFSDCKKRFFLTAPSVENTRSWCTADSKYGSERDNSSTVMPSGLITDICKSGDPEYFA